LDQQLVRIVTRNQIHWATILAWPKRRTRIGQPDR
jgi:hypothetical protein